MNSKVSEKLCMQQGGVLQFSVMDHDWTWSNDFQGEAFMDISSLVGVTCASSNDSNGMSNSPATFSSSPSSSSASLSASTQQFPALNYTQLFLIKPNGTFNKNNNNNNTTILVYIHRYVQIKAYIIFVSAKRSSKHHLASVGDKKPREGGRRVPQSATQSIVVVFSNIYIYVLIYLIVV